MSVLTLGEVLGDVGAPSLLYKLGVGGEGRERERREN